MQKFPTQRQEVEHGEKGVTKPKRSVPEKKKDEISYEEKLKVLSLRNEIESDGSIKIEAALEQIDFDIMETIFQEIYRKSDIDIEKQASIYVRKFIKRDSILPRLTGEEMENTPTSTLAITKFRLVNRPGQLYSTIEPFIEFNSLAKRFHIKNDQSDIFADVLKIILHEEVHSTQFHGSIGRKDYEEGHSSVEVIGVSEAFSSYTVTGDDVDLEMEPTTNRLLNEGLVEIIADSVIEEYLKRTGRTKILGTFFKAYPLGRILVDLLVRKIVFETGVSNDVVLNALIRGSYEGISLMHSELHVGLGDEVKGLLEACKYLEGGDKDSEEEVVRLCREFMKMVDVERSVDHSILKFVKGKGI